MWLLRILSVAMYSLLLGFSADLAADSGDEYCTDLEQMNSATSRKFEIIYEIVFETDNYRENLARAGFPSDFDESEMRILENDEDSAACQKMNEIVFNARKRPRIMDNERGILVPEVLLFAFAFRSYHVGFLMHYSPGAAPGESAPIIMESSTLYLFDQNMNLVGSSGL